MRKMLPKMQKRMEQNIQYERKNLGEIEIYVLGDELELVQVVYNYYSKRRLVNFYSLMNYIHLKWNRTQILWKTLYFEKKKTPKILQLTK